MKLGKLFKSLVNVVELPIEVAKDILTLGGATTGEDTTYTRSKVEELAINLDEVAE